MPRHYRKPSFRSICRRSERVDCRNLERELDSPDTRKVDREPEQIGATRQRREPPSEGEREMVLIRRRNLLGEVEHGILEGEKDARVYLERQMEVERTTASLLGVQVHLPRLAKRVGLDEVPLVVNVKSVIDRMVLQVGHVSRYVYDCHSEWSLIARCVDLALLRGPIRVVRVNDQALLAICGDVVDSVRQALDQVDDWGLPGGRPGQYGIDLVADSAALDVLDRAGLGVLSEESGLRRADAPLMAVIDPVDGSTNASRGIPWYVCSVCVLDELGPLVSLVANLSSGIRYWAVRGDGAWRDGVRLAPSDCESIGEAVVALSGYPRRHMGWSQYRAFGAASLDLCAVAEGMIDAYTVVGRSALGSWDYLGGMLVCTEAGAHVQEVDGLDLVTTGHSERRSVAAAATPGLLAQVVERAKAARPAAGDESRMPGGTTAAD